MISLLRKVLIRYSPDNLISSVLVDVPLKTLKGTIRKQTDYDDAWFYAIAQNSNVIFDIGCNHGYTAILGLIANRHNKMLLVDANPLAMAKATKNLAVNNLINNCQMFIGFVSDKPDESLKFYTVGSGAAGSMFKSHARTAGAANVSLSVNTTTIDVLMKQYNLMPDFVKIDVEGAESFVLNGSMELASRKKTRFLVEMHSSPEMLMADNARKVLQWGAETGFSTWYMKEQTLLQTEQQIAHRGKCHLLLQPEGWDYPDFLTGIQQGDALPSTF